MQPLIDHLVYRGAVLPDSGQLYDYLLAGNGVFVQGTREGLSACVPVAPAAVRGLPDLTPHVVPHYPPVPAGALAKMLECARAVRQGGQPIEALFHLSWQPDRRRWHLAMPPQEADAGHVRPLDTGAGSTYASALIEVHSHHRMGAFWSATDNADESSGFRLYGVLGTIFTRPTLRLRVGLHGYFLEIDPGCVFDLPAALHTVWEDADAA